MPSPCPRHVLASTRFASPCHVHPRPLAVWQHAVNSCVLKLSKLTKAGKVYRGIKDAKLPKEFWVPNEMGVRGGIECARAPALRLCPRPREPRLSCLA